MRLVIAANILVAELLRARGRAMIAHPMLELRIAGPVWGEAEHELHKRAKVMIVRGILTTNVAERLLEIALITANDRIIQIPQAIYGIHEHVARSRIPHDPDDWHSVALASDADIWTADADILGCGVATRTTDTLLAHLAYVEAE